MNLIVDAGNSQLKMGLLEGGRLIRSHGLPSNSSDAELDAAVRALVGEDAVGRVGIASVVPRVREALRLCAERICSAPPYEVKADGRLPFQMAYATPDTLGADRLAAATAAWMGYGKSRKQPVVSVDAGTATTFEVVTSEGTFIGGAIAPGPGVMVRALAQGTAQLPEVDLETTPRPIGRSTHEAMQAGILYSFVDAVEGMLRRIEQELGEDPIVVLTGGWAPLLSRHLRPGHHHDPHLVLRGVDILMELNT